MADTSDVAPRRPDYPHNGGPPLDDGYLDEYGRDGWIKVARRMRWHPLVGCGKPMKPQNEEMGAWSRYEAWQDLIMECRYQAGSVMNKGRKMEIKPGQLLGAISWLASRWNWSPAAVRWYLDKLQTEGMIDPPTEENCAGVQTDIEHSKQNGKGRGNTVRVITISKYSIYQFIERISQQAEQQASQQAHNKPTASAQQHLKKGIKEENSSTPPPPTGEPAPQVPDAHAQFLAGLNSEDFIGLVREVQRLRTKREKAEKTKAENEQHRATTNEAFRIYNQAATHFGFALCDSFTESRRTRLLKRLTDIGGLDNFRKALRAIARDDFLAGRKHKPGVAPFKLDFERLLSTDSQMGDVLARLLDLSAREEEPKSPNGKVWGWWRANAEGLRTLPPDYWQRRLDALKPNGTWPWWDLGAPPGHEEAIIHPEIVQKHGLAEKYKGKIHA